MIPLRFARCLLVRGRRPGSGPDNRSITGLRVEDFVLTENGSA